MADLILRPLAAGDITHIADHLREGDRDELAAVHGSRQTAGGAIARAVLLSSHVWVADDGEPFAIFGAAPVSLLSGIGSPWLLATDRVHAHPRNLVVEGRRYLARIREAYPRLFNYVDARNHQSIRWLKRLGFVLEPAAPYGAAGLPFHRFTMGGA